ncbi:miraculin-like [Diospyros lotus]|uniref:miraculin-like n=1 Tax=Diospyros lotus TaxID=55363 RepID=UPI002251E7F4|nr:miraculin-like [Diospyros lotus]
MKSSLLLLLSFLLLSSLPNLLMADNLEPLYDSSGDKVVTGTRYYLVPAFSGHGGGLYAKPSTCPGEIFQENSDSLLGQAVLFYPANYTYVSGTVVHESSALDIHFSGQACRKAANAWTVSYFDDVVGAWIVTAYGFVGNPGPYGFKFEKVCNDNVYQILFDPPTALGLPKSYVGVTSEAERRTALISVPPLRLKIVKASDALQVKEARLNKGRIASVV